MDLALVILAALAAILIFSFARANLMFVIIIGSITTLTGFGIMANDGTAEWSTFWSFGSCVFSLSLGYLLFSRRGLHDASTPTGSKAITNSTSRISDGAVMGTVLSTSFLALYHLFAGGIPLFSETIEVERFDFTSSGFFGIPGRMYLYGVPMAWAFATAVAHYKGIKWTAYKPWKWATAAYLIISILSGFKSGLSATFILMLVFSVAITGKKLLLRQLVVRYWWALILPLAYGLVVAASYKTYQSSALPPWRQFIDRITLVGAQPKQLAIEHYVYGAQPGVVWDDFLYFLKKYTGGDVSGLYSFERAVSAQIIGVNPASSAWTTPVTVGGIPEFIFSFGFFVSIIIFFVIGCFIRSLHRPAAGPYTGTLKCILLFVLYSWLTKGGFAYYTLNITAVALMLTAIYAVLNALLSGVHTRHTTTENRLSHQIRYFRGQPRVLPRTALHRQRTTP